MISLFIALLVLSQAEAKPTVAAQKSTLALVESIPLPDVEGRIDHMAFAPNVWNLGSTLVVAALENNSVESVSLAAHVRMPPPDRTGVSSPQGVVFMQLEGEPYYAFTNDGSGDLEIRNFLLADPQNAMTRIHVGADLDNVRFDPIRKVLIVGYGAGGIAIVGTGGKESRIWAVLARIPLDAHPESFQIDAAAKRCWVNVPDKQSIAVVDLEARKVLRSIEVASAKKNYPMALAESAKRLLIGCREPGKLLVFDIETDKQVAELPLSGDVDDIFVDDARGLVYASCGEGFVDVFERTEPGAWKPKEKVATSAGARTCLFVASEKRLFVAVPHRGDQKAEIRVFSTAP